MNTHFVQKKTKQQLRQNINKHVKNRVTRKRMGPLTDENKLQLDIKDIKTEKFNKTENKHQKL